MNELTYCIPVYNGASTIKLALSSLMKQYNIKPLVIINVTWSLDGTMELVSALKRNNWFSDMELELLSVPPPRIVNGKPSAYRAGRIAIARKQLVDRVKTPFLMFIDSDVLLSSNTVKPILEAIEEDLSIGMLGIRYNGSEHVRMGATMMRTVIAKDLNWNVREGCDCQHIGNQLKAMNLKVLHAEVDSARHLIFDKVE